MNEIEITGDALTKTQVLYTVIGRTRQPAESIAGSAKQYRDFIERNDLGVRKAPNCKIVDSAGKTVATVSFNGRVWAV